MSENNLTFSQTFNSPENKIAILRLVTSNLTYNLEGKEQLLKDTIQKNINTWIKLGKFKQLDNTMIKTNNYDYDYDKLKYFNFKFVKVFEDNIVKVLRESDSYLNQFNPYREELLKNKSVDNYMPADYNKLNVQSNDTYLFDFTKRRTSTNNRGAIPLRNRQLHKRNFDKDDIGSLYEEEERVNLKYKRYPIDGELFGKN